MISVKKYPHIIVNETMSSALHRAAAESLSDFLKFSTISSIVIGLLLCEIDHVKLQRYIKRFFFHLDFNK